MSDDGLSFQSDRELDRLSQIPSCESSHTNFASKMYFSNSRAGMSDPPHHHHQEGTSGSSSKVREASMMLTDNPVHSNSWAQKTQEENGESTPIRKLKHRGTTEIVDFDHDKPSGGISREYSDAYLEGNLRTPRYGTHTSYNDMVDDLHDQDPFKGDYKPSGKVKKSKSKKRKKTSSRDRENDSVTDPLSGSKRHSKRNKGSDSVESNKTFTISGVTNPSYSTDNEKHGDSLSTGTYTLQNDDDVDGNLGSIQINSRKSFSAGKSFSVARKRGTVRRSTARMGSGISIKVKFTEFVRRNKIMIRVPLPESEIQSVISNSPQQQGKHIWHYHTHTRPEPCDSFGVISFQGFGSEIDPSPYIRCSPDTKPGIIWDMMINQWHLESPQLIISVTGGAQRFEMKKRMQDRFKQGLIHAAVSTSAWIITGGTKTGVMEFVGDAVKDHVITSGRKDDVVSLGIATWGCVANRDALDGDDIHKDGLFPAIYSKADVIESQLSRPRNVPLDESHSHFILVDDGSEDKFGGEISFRTSLEKFISDQHCDPDDRESSLTIPVIQLIVEGGINSMKTVWSAVKTGVPVLVLASSGRAADFIAYGYKITTNKMNEEKSFFPKTFNEEMEEMANRVFEWKEKDQPRKPALVANCLKQLREALEHREMLTVFDLNDVQRKEFDRAILYALLKANRSNTNAQLSLALAWNRSDIAKNEIFTAANKTNYQELKLDDAMMTALIQDRLEFVKLFLENGINLHQFLDIKNLWNLYSNCFYDESDGAAQLLMNRISYLRQTWGAYLCCKRAESVGIEPDLLNYIGKVIVHLLGDESMNMYAGDRFDVINEEVVFGYIPKSTENTAATYLSRTGKILTKHRSKVIYQQDFTNPAKELFIWAILMNRVELAKLFWRIGSDHVGGALFASCLLKALSKVADDEEEIEISVSLKQHSEEFEMLASNVLHNCYLSNRDLAHQLLVRKMKDYGNTTLFSLADENVLMDFMEQTCCQTKLNSIWKGRMALYTSTFKIVLSIIFPFLIPAIKFTTKTVAADVTYGDAFDDLGVPPKEGGTTGNEADGHTGGKVAPEPEDEKMSKAKILKQKLYHVNCFGKDGDGQEGISIFHAIISFYTAPVTKFWTNLFSYVLFLGLFTFFILTDLYPIGTNDSPSIPEIIVWVWTITMVLEEVRQILTRDQRSLWYKVRSWYGSVWNRFDFMMYLFFLTSVILRYTLTGTEFTWARMLYSITLGMFYIRFMHFFYVEKNIGPKVIMINRMLTDLLFFMLILVVFILSFGVAYQANLYPNKVRSWSVLKDVVYYPYWQMYGELFLEQHEGEDPAPDACTYNETLWRYEGYERCPEKNAIVVVLMAAYMLVTNILLVNLLIAMFSDTFQKVQDNSEKVWRYYRFSLVYEFYERPAFFPPLIFFNHVFRGCRWIFYKLCSCGRKTEYKNTFKLHLKDKDDARLALFVRGCVEDYLHCKWSRESQEIDKKISNTSDRLEKVIEELDEIKENVMEREKQGIDSIMATTARSLSGIESHGRSMSIIEPEVLTSRKTEAHLEREMGQLSEFVRQEMHNLNASVVRLEKLFVASQKQLLQQKSLDITNVTSSES